MPPGVEAEVCTSQYERHCKGEFASLREGQAKTHKKLFESNGERALVELVRDNAQGLKRLTEVVADHIETSRKERPQRTSKQLKIGSKGIVIDGYTGSDLAKIVLLVILVVYMVGSDVVRSKFGQKHTNEVTSTQ